MKNFSKITTSLISSIILLILFWSPWLYNDGGENIIRKLQTTEEYSQIMNKVSRNIQCEDLYTVWSPFGGKIKYCDRAEWYVTFWGKIMPIRFIEYVPDENKNKLLKKLDFYIDGGEKDFCKNWNFNYPIIATAELIDKSTTKEDYIIDEPMRILKFKIEGKEQNFLFPSSKINLEKYEIGKLYDIDLNNICIFYDVMLLNRNNSSEYKKLFKIPIIR